MKLVLIAVMRPRILSLGVVVGFGRENAEESPLLECLFKHRNEIIQMKTDKKMAYVNKSIFH